MSKTRPIDFRSNEQMQAIDDELDAAMNCLEQTTARVGDVLTSYINEGKLTNGDRPPAAELDDAENAGAASTTEDPTSTDD